MKCVSTDSGFLTILFVFIRAAFRNINSDTEASEKLARIRMAIGWGKAD